MKKLFGVVIALIAVLALSGFSGTPRLQAQASGPTVVDPNLAVRTVVSDLTTPVSMAFLGRNDFLILEKNTGMVKRVQNGVVSTVLDLAVNNASERGLLGIALHPDFPKNPGVYLYWTCMVPAPTTNLFFPTAQRCPTTPGLGADTSDILAVPLLGNRVDRFVWNAAAGTLTFDKNLIMLHAFQADGAPIPPNQGDEAQPARGNHNGGVLRFGPDEKLYIIIGDNGRRGQLQNLLLGPTPPKADDQFGGPQPDDAHLTGVVLRLNADGSTPGDNPFSRACNDSSEACANIKKIYAYGVRNSFGMAFDPESGVLWNEENGDDSFDEINRITPGQNNGWVQVMGPLSRIAQFKAIETSPAPFFGLQQLRWSPLNIANTPAEAQSRLVMIPGAHYSDPAFSWKYAVAPAAVGFLDSDELGRQYKNDLFVGASRTNLADGYLFHFNLTGNRGKIAVDDPRLEDRVADNAAKFDISESESLLFGSGFGIGTDIHTGPNGNLYVVSLSNGAVYEVYRLHHEDDDHSSD